MERTVVEVEGLLELSGANCWCKGLEEGWARTEETQTGVPGILFGRRRFGVERCRDSRCGEERVEGYYSSDTGNKVFIVSNWGPKLLLGPNGGRRSAERCQA